MGLILMKNYSGYGIHYNFYIMNSDYTPYYGYSLWVNNEGTEFQVIQSNSSQSTQFNSTTMGVGNAIQPTEEFFHLVSEGFRMLVSHGIISNRFINEDFRELAEEIYGGKTRDYEIWCASSLIGWMFSDGNDWIPELEPIVEWTNRSTSFDVPIYKQKPRSIGDGE